MPARRESIGGTGNGLVSRRGQAFLLLKRIWRPLEPILGFVRKVGSQATVDARHAYHRLKATCQLFIACGDAATFFKPTKAAFYRIPLPIFGFVEPPG